MTGFENYIGEACALSAAIVWALAVIFFRRSGEAVHPIGLNIFKNILAMILLVPTAWLFGETLLRPTPVEDYLLLLLSGALGIGIADTLFFKSLNILGAGMSAIVDLLYSPVIIGLSILWLGDQLNFWQVVGVLMILSAVSAAVGERKNNQVDRRQMLMGVLWGALAMLSMGVGIVMVKPLLNVSPLIWATEVRLIGGMAVLAVVLMFHPSRRAIVTSIGTRHRWGYMVTGSILGAYVSMILWLAGMKFTQTSIAAALNQTTNIFIFIFAALILKERVTLIKSIAIVAGVIGALLVTFG
ncbi:MAG: DMT family transporter [candidate division Zixibacteria bacterium]|nr:DMT family transporter [candidate division Zixibacteria bacterium]